MSQQNFEASEPTGEPIGPGSFGRAITRKQNFNIYTVMLIIAFVCLLVGTYLMLLELWAYGNFPNEQPWKTSDGIPAQASLIVDWFQQIRV